MAYRMVAMMAASMGASSAQTVVGPRVDLRVVMWAIQTAAPLAGMLDVTRADLKAVNLEMRWAERLAPWMVERLVIPLADQMVGLWETPTVGKKAVLRVYC